MPGPNPTNINIMKNTGIIWMQIGTKEAMVKESLVPKDYYIEAIDANYESKHPDNHLAQYRLWSRKTKDCTNMVSEKDFMEIKNYISHDLLRDINSSGKTLFQIGKDALKDDYTSSFENGKIKLVFDTDKNNDNNKNDYHIKAINIANVMLFKFKKMLEERSKIQPNSAKIEKVKQSKNKVTFSLLYKEDATITDAKRIKKAIESAVKKLDGKFKINVLNT